MDVAVVKQEISQPFNYQLHPAAAAAITTTYSDSGNDSNSDDDSDDLGPSKKKQKLQVVLPVGFLDPLSPEERLALNKPKLKIQTSRSSHKINVTTLAIRDNEVFGDDKITDNLGIQSCRQFWKAANCFDEEATSGCDSTSHHAAMDRVRVHPRFLHSNATSHKWALGAFAELLDNALDEVRNGATYVQVDVLDNGKDASSKMLLFQDNGGGMTPDKMRQCMSLGYSAKSKLANTIGQYGNGFKTSTMRLGADVVVFSRCVGEDGRSPTQSIGMLSYTFLRKTGKEDIVVPMIDYEKREEDWRMMPRSSPVDWERNLETIMQWSPYSSEGDLLRQFDSIKDHGTRIIIYNLWEANEGMLELDFDSDPHDIQMRGVNRDEKKIEMASLYPNSRHFLTYHHSLRSYAAILYLRLPTGFKIILRGKDVEHHNIINDMMKTEERIYRPTCDQNASAIVTLGFVKDARSHIDIQGFNVYHKNRLIKPFWRVWNAAGSDGRGVIGVLEANFVEPAHDKQGFERTPVLERLENRLIVFQKKYWSENCHEIGYAKRKRTKSSVSPEAERVCSPSEDISCGGKASKKNETADCRANTKSIKRSLPAEGANNDEMGTVYPKTPAKSQHKTHPTNKLSNHITIASTSSLEEACMSGDGNADPDSKTAMLAKLIEENRELKQRLNRSEGMMFNDLMSDLLNEKERVKLLEEEVLRTKQKLEKEDNEHTAFISLIEAEREERDREEADLRERLTEASHTIDELHEKIKLLQSGPVIRCKSEH